MAKLKTVYVCQECGAQARKWQGRCNECNSWSSLQEEMLVPDGKSHGMTLNLTASAQPVAIHEVETCEEERFSTGIDELDRVLGGGIVPGSLVLLGGPPGIGKSTLLLQMARALASSRPPVLYVSGEESPRQIRLRADRLGSSVPGILLLAETRLEAIETRIREDKPGLVMVDSIQTLFRADLAPAPGSVTQVRECAAGLMRMAKELGIPVLLVGHVTKGGQIAGPRVLEHLVDTVLYFEGEGMHNLRALRSVKNRFGATHEIGLFEMGHSGLEAIPDASRFFLSQRAEDTSGSVVFPSLEGSRPVLVELQALVHETSSPNGVPPVRRAVGLDRNRLSLLLAVLGKRCGGLGVGNCDVYANAAGGLRLSEPALDLPLILAVASSKRDIPLDSGLAACGEVGLGGEVRAVTQIEPRLKEIAKMGFSRCLLPLHNQEGLDTRQFGQMEVVAVRSVPEALEAVGIPVGKHRPQQDPEPF